MMRLRVLSTPNTSCSGGCSRRQLLRGVGIAAASSLLGGLGCRLTLDGSTDAGGTGGDSGPGSGTTTMCGTNVCVDLNDPGNTALATVGGSLIVQVPSDKIIVIRSTMTEFAALSDVCTHMACSVRYDAASSLLICPCHGSRFTLTGSVVRGPARPPLQAYSTGFDSVTDVVTIMM